MYATITIARYNKWLGWAGFLSMALFRLPMSFNKNISFYKLLGCGKNGTFDKMPDLLQWGVLAVLPGRPAALPGQQHYLQQLQWYGRAMAGWWRLFGCETWSVLLEPVEGHGLWDGQQVFGTLLKNSGWQGPVGVLTRATIRPKKLRRFWQHVNGAAAEMSQSPGFITSLGVGEVPWIKQATFSVWASREQMKAFAYRMQSHAEVVRKTRSENWYSEEMFTRFKILASFGTLRGKNPLGNLN